MVISGLFRTVIVLLDILRGIIHILDINSVYTLLLAYSVIIEVIRDNTMLYGFITVRRIISIYETILVILAGYEDNSLRNTWDKSLLSLVALNLKQSCFQ